MDVHSRTRDGSTALHLAVRLTEWMHITYKSVKFDEIVKWLVEEKELDLNAKDDNGATPLHYAAADGQVEVTKILVKQRELDLNARDNIGATPLHYATRSEHPKGWVLRFVEWFIKHEGVDVHIKDDSGLTAVDVAIHRDAIISIVKRVDTGSEL
jgi:ankyrin repeat protein